MNSYLKRKATPWVSLAVLSGGLVSAILLVFIYKVDNNFQTANASFETHDLERALEKSGY